MFRAAFIGIPIPLRIVRCARGARGLLGSEQIKTRLEVQRAEEGTRARGVALPPTRDEPIPDHQYHTET